ncbi:MAG TPA: DinB family protein [Bacteroidetes bacterium]|nr:DinB family protein [Bacteroidota bacterium]
MNRTPWTSRIFSFDLPEGWLPNVLERLHGTAVRIKELTSGVNEQALIFKPDGKWSIKEHIGHLIDLENLHEGRIDDFLARKEILRAADMSNIKTYEANHNAARLDSLITEFWEKRSRFITRLKDLDDETQSFSSLHPRLKKHMRPVDMAYFTAEHDDHHLASIRQLIEQYKK